MFEDVCSLKQEIIKFDFISRQLGANLSDEVN